MYNNLYMRNKFIQIKEASEILGVSKLTLRNWDNNGKLRAYRHPISNYRVYRAEDIDNIIRKIETSEKPKNIKKSNSPVYELKVLHLKD